MTATKAKSSKVVYECSDCGAEASKWQGQCTACESWNTLQETTRRSPRRAGGLASASAGSAVTTLDRVTTGAVKRLSTGLTELDRVLGGGLVSGSTIVLGGHPGAGKSTLLLQAGCNIAQHQPVFYVSGEESLEQIADRANRLKLPTDKLLAASEVDVLAIASMIEREKPLVAIIDSIQVMCHPEVDSLPGGATQVRESAAFLNRIAKRTGTVIIMVGHITKTESLAGPMTLNHLVDVTMMLSSTDDARYRIVRADKNRFGSVAEIGVFAMTGSGMREVPNPSAIFLSRANQDMPGSIVTVLWEGSRPLLIEMQALVDQSALGNPRRVSVGIDGTRISMLLAVLHRHGGVAVHDQDVYVNVVGGLRITEPSADLALLMSVVSSLRGKPIPANLFAFGEIGLSGEVRPCANGQERLREAVKHGFEVAIVPAANAPKEKLKGVEVVAVSSLQQALEWVDKP